MIIIIVFLLAYFSPRFRSCLLGSDDAVVSLPGVIALDHVHGRWSWEGQAKTEDLSTSTQIIRSSNFTLQNCPFYYFFCVFTSAKMDLNSLKDQVSNLSLYDIKAGVRKVQNGMLEPRPVVPWAGIDAKSPGSCDELHGDGVEGQ